ncbi:DUF2955 domain-containing protein [Shewanella marina]|uniref:DUF2955 domain-containing protein n=1 Tax=Shewanella marina TaxID=487319 RepID=UPI00046F3995|nr:DUF2955 domain-containing protein [Shewanella marina]
MKLFRIWFATSLGLAISMLMGWSNGMFCILLPVLILSSIDRWQWGPFKQMLKGVVAIGIEVSLIIGFLQTSPVLMFIAVLMLMSYKCYAMQFPSSALFGYSGILIGSILLNFGSYNSFDLSNFIIGIVIAACLAVPLCALAFWLFPEANTVAVPAAQSVASVKQSADFTQVALGTLTVMIIFVLFQCLNLNDSLSAQASMLIVLSPMSLVGSKTMAKIRIKGTLIGCGCALVIQLGLYTLANNPILYFLAFVIALGFLSRIFMAGGLNTALGFSAMSGLVVPLVNSFQPEQHDALFAILYRISSIVVAVIFTAVLIWLLDAVILRCLKLKQMKRAV